MLFQRGALFLAFPVIFLAALAGFLWQFVDYGWALGNIIFNRFYDSRTKEKDHA